MTIYALIREDQNEHGFVDTSIAGLFRDESLANAALVARAQEARATGWRVCGDDAGEADDDWQVSLRIEAHEVE